MVERMNKVARARRSLNQKLGREPTPEEIGEIVEMSGTKVEQILKLGQEPIFAGGARRRRRGRRELRRTHRGRRLRPSPRAGGQGHPRRRPGADPGRAQAGGKVARREIRRIAVPVGKIAREHHHAIGGKHLEHHLKVLGAIRLFDRLGREVDVLEDDLAGPPIEPGCCLAQRPPVFVQPPEERRQPADATLDQHKLKLRKLDEDALGHQADQVSHEAAHEAGVPLKIAARVAGRRWRARDADPLGARVDRNRQAVLDGRGVDGMKGALAVGNARAARHKHLHDARPISEPADLSRCQLGVVGRDRERVAKARVSWQPLLNKDVVDRRCLRGRVIGLWRQSDPQDVLGVEDAVLDLVDIEEVAREMYSAALDALPVLGDGI